MSFLIQPFQAFMSPPNLEAEIFCVLGQVVNHYTVKP